VAALLKWRHLPYALAVIGNAIYSETARFLEPRNAKSCFEIQPAPFVVAHLQIGLLLADELDQITEDCKDTACAWPKT